MALPASSAPDGVRVGLGQLAAMAFWLGAAACFALAVAPATFAVLPSRDLAGAVVGRVLPVLFWSGALIGALAIGLELARERPVLRRARLLAATVIIAACLAAQLLVAPRIAELRSGLRGPLSSLAATDPQRVAFGRLHLFSVAWLGVAMTGGLAFLAFAALNLDRSWRR